MAVIAAKHYAMFINVTNEKGPTTNKRFIARSQVGPNNLLKCSFMVTQLCSHLRPGWLGTDGCFR